MEQDTTNTTESTHFNKTRKRRIRIVTHLTTISKAGIYKLENWNFEFVESRINDEGTGLCCASLSEDEDTQGTRQEARCRPVLEEVLVASYNRPKRNFCVVLFHNYRDADVPVDESTLSVARCTTRNPKYAVTHNACQTWDHSPRATIYDCNVVAATSDSSVRTRVR